MKVIKYVPGPEGTSIAAFVDFYIPEWKLHLCQCKVIKSKKGGWFVAAPARKTDGGIYDPYFRFDKAAQERFDESARKSIEAYIEEKRNGSDTRGRD